MKHASPRWRYAGVRSSFLLLVGLSFAMAACAAPVKPALAQPNRGEQLFARHCALCHGDRGGADGVASPLLYPPARRLVSGGFRLVSTENHQPTDADLLRVLRRGMPGSAMPSFAWLPEADLRHLVRRVRELAVEQTTASLLEEGASERALTPDQARAEAERRLVPRAELEVVSAAEPTAETLARGRQLYATHCAACHGPDGRGEHPEHWEAAFDEHGRFTWARDFTAGVMKGGTTPWDLAWRIKAGIPGSTMPPTELPPDDLGALVAHVRTLLRPGAATRLVQSRERLLMTYVPGKVPTDPDDPLWLRAREVRIVLAPLRWRDNAVLEAWVAALHDGQDVAIRLRWADATKDSSPLGAAAHPDGAALQFSAEPDPPLLGMGSAAHPVNLWHWRPFRPEDVSVMLEQGQAPRHARQADAPLHGKVQEARSLAAEGVASATRFASDALILDAVPRWRDDQWSVVFRRAARARTAAEFSLFPGQNLQVGFAVWNGTARGHDAEKSISIWHELAVE